MLDPALTRTEPGALRRQTGGLRNALWALVIAEFDVGCVFLVLGPRAVPARIAYALSCYPRVVMRPPHSQYGCRLFSLNDLRTFELHVYAARSPRSNLRVYSYSSRTDVSLTFVFLRSQPRCRLMLVLIMVFAFETPLLLLHTYRDRHTLRR